MKYTKKTDNAGRSSGMLSFALCSLFLLLGAAAGCYSGSHVAADTLFLGEYGRSFGRCLAVNLAGVSLVFLLGSSSIGFVLLPVLNGAAGFICGFLMSAAVLIEGGWGSAFARCGWMIAFSLPMFSVLCVCAVRTSMSACRALLVGGRVDGETFSNFFKILMISTALAVLMALAASAA